jgi:hypothetical protein
MLINITLDCFVTSQETLTQLIRLCLNYEDGSNEILYQPGFPDENNYVEYYIASKQWVAISFKKVKSITFRGVGTFKVKSKDKTFFMDFYKKVL